MLLEVDGLWPQADLYNVRYNFLHFDHTFYNRISYPGATYEHKDKLELLAVPWEPKTPTTQVRSYANLTNH